MKRSNGKTISLRVSDASGQKRFTASRIRTDVSVEEMMKELLPRMDYVESDSSQTLDYHVRSEREGRHLYGSEVVGDVLKHEDEVSIHPDVEAGAGS